jgi:hypothetical protein
MSRKSRVTSVLRLSPLTRPCAAEDFVGGLRPDERVAAIVPAVDEAANGAHQVLDGGEAAAADGLARDDAKEDLHQVQPRARRRREVQRHPRVAGKPALDIGMLVGAVVVDHDVQFPLRVAAGHLL